MTHVKTTTEMRLRNGVVTEANLKVKNKIARFGAESGIQFILDTLYRKDEKVLEDVLNTLSDVIITINGEDYNAGTSLKEIDALFGKIKDNK